MTYQQATATVRRRYERSNICVICGEPIDRCDSFEFMKVQDGRRMRYVFFHAVCLGKHDNYKGGVKNAEVKN